MRKFNYVLAFVFVVTLIALVVQLSKDDDVCGPKYEFQYEADDRFRKVFGPVDTEYEQRAIDCIVYGDGCDYFER